MRFLIVSVLLWLWVGAASAQSSIDYEEWAKAATTAEQLIEAGDTEDSALLKLRERLNDWRSSILAARDENLGRIESLSSQIEALGEPKEGAAESDTITARRADLLTKLAAAEAPRLQAIEAIRQADGFLKEIGAVLDARDRQALFARGVSPLSPELWGQISQELSNSTGLLQREIERNAAVDRTSNALSEKMPRVIFFLILGVLLFFGGFRIFTWLLWQMSGFRLSPRGGVRATILSVAEIVFPMLGIYCVVASANALGWFELLGKTLIDQLPNTVFYVVVAIWIANRLFAKSDEATTPISVIANKRLWGRYAVIVMGLATGLSPMFTVIGAQGAYLFDVQSGIDFVFVVLGAFGMALLAIVFRHTLQQSDDATRETVFGFDLARVFHPMSFGLLLAALLGVSLGAFGYAGMTGYFIYSVIKSLAILAIVVVAQNTVRDLSRALSGDVSADEALWPVLVNFSLFIASLPFLALQWGASRDDLLDLWRQVNEGFSLGDIVLSPSTFITLVFVFTLGFILTRVVQRAFKTSILPRTRIERSGQVALVSGIGYLGIFLSAVIAITSAGLDLSSLAIVAGALSVGIGFGLQNIVSNFVSGIILLIERPIGQGDWIEVGGKMGYVKDISVRSTRIETFDRSDVIVPNSDLIAGTVTNYTRRNSAGRIILQVGVAYGTDTRRVEEILREIGTEHAMVSLDPGPNVVFQGFGADSLDFELRCTLRDINWGLTVKSELNHRIAERFKEEGIDIPFAQREITIKNIDQLKGD